MPLAKFCRHMQLQTRSIRQACTSGRGYSTVLFVLFCIGRAVLLIPMFPFLLIRSPRCFGVLWSADASQRMKACPWIMCKCKPVLFLN